MPPRKPSAPVRFREDGDPRGFASLGNRFLEWMRVKNYSERTVENRHVYLGYFFDWCRERGLNRPTEVTKPVLERYQRWMFHYRKANGQPMSFRTQHSRLTPIRAFFRWCARNNHLLYNPASELELPKLEKRLPRAMLSVTEVEAIMAGPELGASMGMRDRAILETLYSTGMRRMEVVNLKVFDLDAERGTIMVRQGKGKKDRMVPIGERALTWIQKYVDEVRPGLAVAPDDGTLFLTAEGELFTPNRLTQLVREYVDKAKLKKRGSCHLFRHTMATLMLEGGADIRFIQAMLGHAELSTTQIYTQVSIRKLKEIHDATHPGARPATRRTAAEDHDPEAGARADLLDALDAEAQEEDDGPTRS